MFQSQEGAQKKYLFFIFFWRHELPVLPTGSKKIMQRLGESHALSYKNNTRHMHLMQALHRAFNFELGGRT